MAAVISSSSSLVTTSSSDFSGVPTTIVALICGWLDLRSHTCLALASSTIRHTLTSSRVITHNLDHAINSVLTDINQLPSRLSLRPIRVDLGRSKIRTSSELARIWKDGRQLHRLRVGVATDSKVDSSSSSDDRIEKTSWKGLSSLIELTHLSMWTPPVPERQEQIADSRKGGIEKDVPDVDWFPLSALTELKQLALFGMPLQHLDQIKSSTLTSLSLNAVTNVNHVSSWTRLVTSPTNVHWVNQLRHLRVTSQLYPPCFSTIDTILTCMPLLQAFEWYPLFPLDDVILPDNSVTDDSSNSHYDSSSGVATAGIEKKHVNKVWPKLTQLALHPPRGKHQSIIKFIGAFASSLTALNFAFPPPDEVVAAICSAIDTTKMVRFGCDRFIRDLYDAMIPFDWPVLQHLDLKSRDAAGLSFLSFRSIKQLQLSWVTNLQLFPWAECSSQSGWFVSLESLIIEGRPIDRMPCDIAMLLPRYFPNLQHVVLPRIAFATEVATESAVKMTLLWDVWLSGWIKLRKLEVRRIPWSPQMCARLLACAAPSQPLSPPKLSSITFTPDTSSEERERVLKLMAPLAKRGVLVVIRPN